MNASQPRPAPAAHHSHNEVTDDDLEAALIAALDEVLPRYQRTLKHALVRAEGENRLTMPQLRCLQAVGAEADGALTTQLARQLQVAVPTMTSMLDGLAERGLVERRPDPASRRQVRIVLTRGGRDVLRRYERVMDDRLRELLAHLSPPQRSRLLAALHDVAAMLDADQQAHAADVED